jgi:hypothetical protein
MCTPDHNKLDVSAHVIINHTLHLYKKKGRFKAVWINPRLEEKSDCIFRLPPPGNGKPRQTRLTEFFGAQAPVNSGRISLQPLQRTMIKHSILQWNARSLDDEKAAELSRLAAECGASVLLISELGPRKTIANFKAIACSDMFTQSGIFIHLSLSARIVETDHLEHDRIIVRAAIIDEAFLIIHPYIPPESSHRTRKKFWRKIEQFCLKHNNVPIILSGDLNTRSPLFNENHRESHDYLNDLLDAAESSINNTGEPTRGPNALDVTMRFRV